MLVLVLIACLNAECRVVQLSEPVVAAGCMASAQTAAARWVGDHPRYRVKKLLCVRPDQLVDLLDEYRA